MKAHRTRTVQCTTNVSLHKFTRKGTQWRVGIGNIISLKHKYEPFLQMHLQCMR